MTPAILLSFDLEEFDAPLEYGQTIAESEQMDVCRRGMEALAPLLQEHGARSTLFTTAHFALHHESLIRELALTHEIASHGFYHSQFELADLASSKTALEGITGQPVTGFRRARLAPTDPAAVADAGYRYNSSENPIWLPGRYNHFFDPRTAYFVNQLLHIPASASPIIRFPLFWLAFKNAPLSLIKSMSRWTLRHDGYLCLYFHPWEFVDLSRYRLPSYVRRHSGPRMLDRLDSYLRDLSRVGRFITTGEFAADRHAARAAK